MVSRYVLLLFKAVFSAFSSRDPQAENVVLKQYITLGKYFKGSSAAGASVDATPPDLWRLLKDMHHLKFDCSFPNKEM